MTDTIPNVPRELKPVLAMILNALDRDAADGKQARAEMAAELRALLSAQSSANHVEDVRAMVVPDRSKEFSQFLTSVITAAGLLAYGKQSKGLASYLSDKAMMYMLAASPSANGGE